MNREDVEKIRLGEDKSKEALTDKPRHIAVVGLPWHLEAKIDGADQSGFRYRLNRSGDGQEYKSHQLFPTPEAALQGLKNLLNWDHP